ncbi:hypothetical protein L249_0037 [Ophiocordyceps polyrhachis-furcata BCC 54312]|uniref:Enoyl-CoA hydratase n=1 Tax=Ophiocordyceps polyrhachis-furcata BCC 54312 TaxID=1330021 RepID=A0A367LEV9_9HYPO|nr:hypothetical protein L249_0037 [Ophiocordyceps polyrhachis-furcata BCC 54312]
MPPLTLRLRLRLRHRPHPLLLLSRHYASKEPPHLLVTNIKAPSSGTVRLLELNRPRARNALSVELVRSLRREFEDVRAQYDGVDGKEVASSDEGDAPTRALVIASAVDACFCAGADLKERRSFTAQQTTEFLSSLRETMNDLSCLPIPTIAAISSLALGGGLELALCTHLRVMTTNAKVGLPETRLAIIPGAGGTHRLADVIGRTRARDLILTGRRVAAPEAYFLGLADRLVELPPDDDGNGRDGDDDKSQEARLLHTARVAARSEALRLAFEICEGGPVAIRAAVEAVAAPSPLKEADMYRRVVDTDDRNEALAAFQEKRKPVFKGC